MLLFDVLTTYVFGNSYDDYGDCFNRIRATYLDYRSKIAEVIVSDDEDSQEEFWIEFFACALISPDITEKENEDDLGMLISMFKAYKAERERVTSSDIINKYHAFEIIPYIQTNAYFANQFDNIMKYLVKKYKYDVVQYIRREYS